MLEVYLAFGTVPEVDGLGDEGVVLGLEELLEEVVEDGSLALADVLALGGLVMTVAGCTGVGAGGSIQNTFENISQKTKPCSPNHHRPTPTWFHGTKRNPGTIHPRHPPYTRSKLQQQKSSASKLRHRKSL